MFCYVIVFLTLLQSISSQLPPYITKCPLPDPNANDCLLNNARTAYDILVQGEPNFNLPPIVPFPIIDLTLILEYVYERNHTTIQLNGILTAPDTYLYEASFNLNWPSWHFLAGCTSLTSNFDFLLTIYDEGNTIQAKGNMIVEQKNLENSYTGHYIKQKIGNELYMQIDYGYSFVTDDNFDITYTELTTLDNQPFTGATLIRVKKALRNFETSYHQFENEISADVFTIPMNQILKLVPENELFIASNPCPTL